MQDFDGRDGRQALRACGEGRSWCSYGALVLPRVQRRDGSAAGSSLSCAGPPGLRWLEKPLTADYSVTAHQRRFSHAMDTLAVDDAVFVLHDFGASIAAPWLWPTPSGSAASC